MLYFDPSMKGIPAQWLARKILDLTITDAISTKLHGIAFGKQFLPAFFPIHPLLLNTDGQQLIIKGNTTMLSDSDQRQDWTIDPISISRFCFFVFRGLKGGGGVEIMAYSMTE